jgi:hypothetical protein
MGDCTEVGPKHEVLLDRVLGLSAGQEVSRTYASVHDGPKGNVNLQGIASSM